MTTATQTQKKPRQTRRSTAGAAGLQLSFWESEPVDISAPPSPPAPKRRKKSASPASAPSPEVAEQVGQEILGGDLNPAEWASALAETGAADGRAVAEYARLRMENLNQQHLHSRRKELEMEMRRRHSCGPALMNQRRRRSTRQENPSIPGLFLAFLGLWGICAASHAWNQPPDGLSLFWSSCLTAIALLAILIGAYFLSTPSVRRFFAGTRTLGVGSLLCGISLLAAISMALRPLPAGNTAKGTSPPRPEPATDYEMSVAPAPEHLPVSRR